MSRLARRGLIALGVAVLGMAVAVLQVTVADRVAMPGGVAPDLPLVAAVLAGLARGPTAGMLAGFAGGLGLDLAPPSVHPAGELALAFCLAGYGSGRASGWAGRSVPRRLVVVPAGAAAGEALRALAAAVLGDPGITAAAARHVIPWAVGYDTLAGGTLVVLAALAARARARHGLARRGLARRSPARRGLARGWLEGRGPGGGWQAVPGIRRPAGPRVPGDFALRRAIAGRAPGVRRATADGIAPRGAAPAGIFSRGTGPGRAFSRRGVPGRTVAGRTVPGRTVPGRGVSGSALSRHIRAGRRAMPGSGWRASPRGGRSFRISWRRASPSRRGRPRRAGGTP